MPVFHTRVIESILEPVAQQLHLALAVAHQYQRNPKRQHHHHRHAELVANGGRTPMVPHHAHASMPSAEDAAASTSARMGGQPRPQAHYTESFQQYHQQQQQQQQLNGFSASNNNTNGEGANADKFSMLSNRPPDQ